MIRITICKALVVMILSMAVVFTGAGCVDGEDIINTDPNYSGSTDAMTCESEPSCPQVCRYYVNDTGTDRANGRSWKTALRHIQPAINKAHCTMAACESITQCDVWVAGRLPYSDSAIEVGGVPTTPPLPPQDYVSTADNRGNLPTIRLRNKVNLFGGFAGTEASPDERWFVKERPAIGMSREAAFASLSRLDRIDNQRSIEVEGNARIDGFLFAGNHVIVNEGAMPAGGAAIWAHGAGVAISNCYFVSNGGRSSLMGGAVYVEGGNAEISYSVFEDNHAKLGGAVALTGGTTTIDHCIFHDNSAWMDGGAILKRDAAGLVIHNSILSSNRADAYGGAVKIDSWNVRPGQPYSPANQSLDVVSSFFVGNLAKGGSSIEAKGFEGVTMTQTIVNCTFYNNMDTYLSATLSLADGRITNSIVWTDTETAFPLVEEAEIFSSVIKNWIGVDSNTSADPLLEPVSLADTLAMKTLLYVLDENSPCIDAGNGDVAPQSDLVGNPRIDISEIPNTGAGVINYTDIGAVEALSFI
ncbi:MAG: hypothetical protein JXR76_17595 [Deltaproteobacteria bacterium]|nr:hypothetical protein [Deltaproteobacteria bacterium]